MTSLERKLERACAVTHLLLERMLDQRLGVVEVEHRRRETQALLEADELPVAVFSAPRRAPTIVNAAWRAQLAASELPEPLHGAIDDAARVGAAQFLAALAIGDSAVPTFVAAAVRPLRGSLGAPAGAIVVCSDVTDAHVAELAGAPPEALIWGGAIGGGASYVNARWRTYTGSSAAEGWLAMIHQDDRANVVAAITERAADRRVVARICNHDDQPRWHDIAVTVDRAGGRWLASAVDVHDSHVARTTAEQAHRVRDRVLAAVSHELRTPLTTMLLWEKILRGEDADAALRSRALQAIHESAVVQSRLVGDLLDISRAISGKLYVDLRPVPIADVLQEVVDAHAPLAAAKQLSLELAGPPAGDVQGDRARLHQVFDNLLSNAIKFTEPGGTVRVHTVRLGKWIAVTVEDTGRGIPPDFLPRLFEPFSQLDDPISRRSGGLGLGLAIAKQLVELHDGALTADSEGVGKGARFTVTLPVSRRRAAPSPPVGTLRPRALEGTRVLVVDDDPRVRDALSLLLGRAGAQVVGASGPDAARAQLARETPDVMICDLSMPDEDGYVFIETLRSAGSTVRAIALSAHATEADSKRARAAGFDLHLGKPIDLDRLIESILALKIT